MVSPRSYQRITKSNDIRFAIIIRDIVMQAGVLTATPDVVWWVTEYLIHRVQQNLSVRRLMLGYKLMQVDVVK